MQIKFLKKKKTEEKKKEIRYILTIDGGGMRGIVPAYILKEMNEELKKRTNRPLYSFFDLVAGTSTGALIALGLTCPTEDTSFQKEEADDYRVEKTYTKGRFFKKEYNELVGFIEHLADPDNFVDLYKENGGKIFRQKEVKGLMRVINTFTRFFNDKYEIAPYEDFLSSFYGETPLSEAVVPTMAVSYNVNKGEKFIFRSWDSHGFLVREAARASSAAPTYFAPAKFIDRETGEELTLIDGGIIANNPILAAYIETVRLYPEADEYRFISLSTASAVTRMTPEEFSSNLSWMGPLMSAYGSANMKISLEGVESIPNVKVLRVWDDVLKTHYKLDDISKEAVDALTEAAERIWEKKKDEIISFLTYMVEDNPLPSRLIMKKDKPQESIEDKKEESLALPSL